MVVKGLLVEFKFLAEEFYIYGSEDLVWKGRSMSSNIINKACRTLLLRVFYGCKGGYRTMPIFNSSGFSRRVDSDSRDNNGHELDMM